MNRHMWKRWLMLNRKRRNDDLEGGVARVSHSKIFQSLVLYLPLRFQIKKVPRPVGIYRSEELCCTCRVAEPFFDFRCRGCSITVP
jgi:hypothetical protein